ncbi:Protein TRIGALACTOSYLDIACYLGLYCEROL 3, chloroplastic [Glycine soja]
MVSLSTTPFLPFTAKNASTRFPPPNSFSRNKQRSNRDHRKVVCACIAPPQNFKSQDSSAINFNGSSKSEQLSTAWDHEDDSDVLIECRDVYKSFGEKKILNGVSFKIRHGEAVGIIGPSGTGKSTVLKIIAGLLAPDKGEVYIRGKKRVGLVSDDDISGLRIGLISELVTETLAAVGLKGVEDRLPSELSGGMKKRVLLYDEPTAGLDPIASTVVEDLIRSVHIKGRDARGKPGNIASYVVVTHQHSTIKRAIDRLLFLHKGKIVWEGMTHEFTTSTNPIVQQFASGSLDGPIRY